jgi:hypothetical protein
MPLDTAGIAPEIAHHLTEDQFYAVYRARHLAELIGNLSQNRDEFTDLRNESLSVVCGLIGELLDEAMPGLIWRKRET